MSSAGRSNRGAGLGSIVGGLVLAGGLSGALLLFVAEFTTLYQVHTASSSGPVKSVATGSHHAYAMALIAVVAAAFAVGVWRVGGRPALLAIGVLGAIALLIALLGDLPDAHASGLIGSSTSHYQLASATPSAGLYMETLGAALLIITCVSAFILAGPPPAATRRPSAGSSEA
jgi:hypothetical protein